jgi:4-hydroxy-2-oxoheptanedioate aldolase
MFTNTTKAKLKAGEVVYGCFVRYPDASLAEFVAWQGWDFLVFDGEHGTMEPGQLENMVRAAELRGVTPIARVTTNQPHIILRFMDVGAQGIHVPWVNSGAEAEQAVLSAKYHPRGMRGLAGIRAADLGQTIPLGEYVQRANAETMVIVHIETAEAVSRIDEYLNIDGLDVIFIGPTDLSHSLGLAGQKDHPAVVAEMDKVVAAVSKTGVALGTMVNNAHEAQAWRDKGARYITIGLETLLRAGCRAYLDHVPRG